MSFKDFLGESLTENFNPVTASVQDVTTKLNESLKGKYAYSLSVDRDENITIRPVMEGVDLQILDHLHEVSHTFMRGKHEVTVMPGREKPIAEDAHVYIRQANGRHMKLVAEANGFVTAFNQDGVRLSLDKTYVSAAGKQEWRNLSEADFNTAFMSEVSAVLLGEGSDRQKATQVGALTGHGALVSAKL